MLIDKDTLLANIRKNSQLSMEDTAWVIKMIKEAPEADKWIPVSERLPENNDDVLAYDGSDYFVAWYEPREIEHYGWHSTDNECDVFTPIRAWMPIKPYKEVSDADSN